MVTGGDIGVSYASVLVLAERRGNWLEAPAGDSNSEAVVADFYDTLMRAEASAQILDFLSDAEMTHLKACQVRYLTRILSPGLSQEQQILAREVGLHHTWIGLPADVLAQSLKLR